MSRNKTEAQFVAFQEEEGALNLTEAIIIISAEDHEGIHIAGRIVAEDMARVKRTHMQQLDIRKLDSSPSAQGATTAIVIGCIENSPLLQHLELTGKVDFSPIRGKWECFTTSVVDDPQLGCSCQRALVVAGSDKRGAIYGVYTLSEQIGVSP